MKTLVVSIALATVAAALAMGTGVTIKTTPGKAKNGKAPVMVSISITEGYHIYGPKETVGIPTSIKVKGTNFKLATATFPQTKTISVAGQKLQVYEERVSIPLVIKPLKNQKGIQKVTLIVSTQACNDRVCMPPETKTIDVSVNFGK